MYDITLQCKSKTPSHCTESFGCILLMIPANLLALNFNYNKRASVYVLGISNRYNRSTRTSTTTPCHCRCHCQSDNTRNRSRSTSMCRTLTMTRWTTITRWNNTTTTKTMLTTFRSFRSTLPWNFLTFSPLVDVDCLGFAPNGVPRMSFLEMSGFRSLEGFCGVSFLPGVFSIPGCTNSRGVAGIGSVTVWSFIRGLHLHGGVS